MPAEQVGEDASGQNADHSAAREDEAEHPHRLGAVRLLREEEHQQRERDRGDDRSADALDGASRDQEPLRVREPAAQRGSGEERDADQEQPPVPEEVAEPAAEQEKAAEGQQVGVHDPRERLLREAEIVPDRRQRDVHDRAVEDDHDVAQAKDVEGDPAAAVVHRHRRSFLSVSKA